MIISNKSISEDSPCYIIAEIGHNHQGDGSKALELVKAASKSGVSAVKFQKRNNPTLFSRDFYHSAYHSKNSFGKTYGEHRQFLEPKAKWLIEANQLANKLGLHFIITVFDIESLRFCEENLNVDAYKIQSADLTYIGLIEEVINTKKPFFLSCGASSLEEIKEVSKFCCKRTNNFCLMYAVSSYPTRASHLNLNRIPFLKQQLGLSIIGYSCHFQNNMAAEYARVLGVAAIEKHFTLDRSQKGPDHFLSTTPDEMQQLIESLRLVDEMKGIVWKNEATIEPYQIDARVKMGKCAFANKTIAAGSTLNEADICFQSPAIGINPMGIRNYIGQVVWSTIHEGNAIQPEYFTQRG